MQGLYSIFDMERYGLSIHYGEIALKGKLRPRFEKILRENIRYETGLLPSVADNRLILDKTDETTKRLLKLTPGVSWFGDAIIIDREDGLLMNSLKNILSVYGSSVNFDVKRIDKKFGSTSLELKEKIAKTLGIRFDPHGHKLRVEIMPKNYIINYSIQRGIGGVPVGSAGKIISLFSGGIDSAVVPLEMMKRGCIVDLLHVYSVADQEEVLNSKISEIVKRLSSINPIRLYMVPFHFFSMDMISANPRYELVLFKRFLIRLAEEIAYRYGYKAIANGDSLSQVASQTLDNINSISYGINLPVFRPLLSYNKEDIIDLAKKYGTYELSLQKYKDCCSLVAKNPLTTASMEKVKEFEKKIDLDLIVNESLSKMSVKLFSKNDD